MELNKEYFTKCISKKSIAIQNSEYIRRLGIEKVPFYGKDFKKKMARRADRIINCLNYWQWNKYEQNKILDLQKVFRCKDLFCPNCRTWNVAKAIINFTPFFRDLITLGYKPYLMTLTVPNISGEKLSNEINEINRSFKKMWNWLNRVDKKGFDDRLFKAVGAIKVLELTVNEKTTDFHIHSHVIIFLENECQEDFLKTIPGGYRYKNKSYIYYSEADIFIQKLWTMAYKNIEISEFEKQSDDWQDNYICDIRSLEMPGGIYEVFKYCFKDIQIYDSVVFENIFFGLVNRRLRQGYGMLYGINKEKEIDEIVYKNIDDFLEVKEDPEKLVIIAISDMVRVYNNYKKISRFKSDKEYINIKD